MLCENIKTRREALGLSQQQLADRLHVVRQTVSKWEQGLSVPDCDMLIRLAEQLGCSAAQLLGQSGAAAPDTDIDTDSLMRETQQLRQETQQMAEELAELNEQYAQEKRGRIRRRRITAMAVLALTVVSAVRAAVRNANVVKELGIIGGAAPQLHICRGPASAQS